MSMKSGFRGEKGKRYLSSEPDTKIVKMRCMECRQLICWEAKTPRPQPCPMCGRIFHPLPMEPQP